jgi:hypothetical protein
VTHNETHTPNRTGLQTAIETGQIIYTGHCMNFKDTTILAKTTGYTDHWMKETTEA